ncbi:uncharacterized protein LOC144702213 [Wolffia australiana]
MMGVWAWMTELPDPADWPEKAEPRFTLELAGSPTKSIVLKAERTAALASFSVALQGFSPSKTLWVSDPCPLSAEGRLGLYPLLLQLVQEVIARAPPCSAALGGGVGPPKLDLRRFFESSGGCSQFASFFDLVFLCRLFWLCACDSPAEVGYLFFQAMSARLESSLHCGDAMRGFLLAAGVDWEMYFMRSLGYLLAKRSILKELSSSSPEEPEEKSKRRPGLGAFSYAAESNGLWVVRAYAPVLSMSRTDHEEGRLPEAKESLLRYALAHQQLESVLQLEYTVESPAPGTFRRVAVRLDNLRLAVAKLGFGGGGGQETAAPDERHFPSRVRFWVGPELGRAGVSCLSLGRSTMNPEREVEREQAAEGGFDGSSKFPRMKAVTRSSGRWRAKSWRWEQEAEGNLAVFDGVLCDSATGLEAAAWRPGAGPDPRGAMRRRYAGPNRAFSKAGGLVVAGDELGQWVSWRVAKDAESGPLTWRVGLKVWVTYWPNELKSSYVETRSVEWHHDVELPLG